MTDEKRALRIDWIQATAGALTAVSSAVLLSTVGVAGTVIGAAVGSVVATVGNAVYSHYIALSKERVAAATLVATRVHRTTARTGPAATGSGYHLNTLQLDRVPDTEQDGTTPEGADSGRARWREALSGLPWKRISLVAAALFVVAMGLIVSFELLTGRAVSTYTGGSADGSARTSIPGLGGRADGAAEPDGGDPDDPDGPGGTTGDRTGGSAGGSGRDGSTGTGGTDTGTRSGTDTGADTGARTGTGLRDGTGSEPSAPPSADASTTPAPSPTATPTPSVAPSQSPAP